MAASKQLDILALEPFYGGERRAMLETVVRCSRHRWTLLKLPPRRMERRLTTAANWFAEQLSRHWVGRVDLLFTSEAMNLASLFRLTPALATYPSVVYFHANQLPDPAVAGDKPTDLVNLSTASAAAEVWFNSAYHQQTFLSRAASLVGRHPELSSRDPIPELRARSRVMPPPVDWSLVDEVVSGAAGEVVRRNPRAVFFETRDADVKLLNEGLAVARRRGVSFNAITVGPVDQLDPALPRWTVSEHDDVGQVRAMAESAVFLSAKPEAPFDYQLVRALIAGCRPVLPYSGAYPDLLPPALHVSTLYDSDPEGLADALEMALEATSATPPAPWPHADFHQTFKAYEAIAACRGFDERLEQMVSEYDARHPRRAKGPGARPEGKPASGLEL